MDPISQGTFGGVFSQFFSSKKKLTVATAIGIISGLAPDLDVFIKSSYDPLLSLEYHRQFTHSLFFIPFGALKAEYDSGPYASGGQYISAEMANHIDLMKERLEDLADFDIEIKGQVDNMEED